MGWKTASQLSEILTDRLTAESQALLRRHDGEHEDKPFFLVLSYYCVHTPFEESPGRIEPLCQRLDALPTPRGPEYLDRGDTTKMPQDNAI